MPSSSSPSSCKVEASVSQMNTQAIRWLCEGRSEQALQLLYHCLAMVKKHMPRDQRQVAKNSHETQVYLTEIPMEGAIGDGVVHNAQELNAGFCLYQFALVVAPIQDKEDNEEIFAQWVKEQEERESRQANNTNESTTTPRYPVLQEIVRDEPSAPHDQEREDVYQEPWNVGTWRLFCGVVTYNLGLVFHELGLGQGRMPLLARARSFYLRGLMMLQQTKPSGAAQTNTRRYSNDVVAAPPDDLPSQWLSCALHNNLGHLAAFWGDVVTCTKAQRGLQANFRTRNAPRLPSILYQSLVQASHTNFAPSVAAAAA